MIAAANPVPDAIAPTVAPREIRWRPKSLRLHLRSVQPGLNELARMTQAEMLVLAGFFIYAALFIYKSSFTIGGVRYFSLFDDDMISMRYAANLAHHHGLVWNPGGERILGVTNLLWVLFMSLFHLLPISTSKISLCVQASGAVFLALSLPFVSEIARTLDPKSRSVGAVAMCLTAFYGPLVNWSVQGTEVSILVLAVTISVWLGLRAAQADRAPYGLYALLGLATLCRIDMSIVAGSLLLSLALIQPHRWKCHLLIGGSIVFAFLIAQLGFDVLYYGHFLPNTYYLKMTGYPAWRRVAHGAFVSLIFVLPFLPLLYLMIKRAPRISRSPAQIMITMVVTGQLLYSIWVGGDAWEWWGGANRFVAIVMPLFFVVLAESIVRMSRLPECVAGDTPPRTKRVARWSLVALVVNALLLGDIYRLPSYLLLAKPLEAAGNAGMVRQALLIRSSTDKDASVAVVWAGVLPYFANRRAIDLLGKNDEKIAREPMHVESELARTKGFWPGHLKWDYAYSIGHLKPDVVVQLWAMKVAEVPSLRNDYESVNVGGYRWYVRRGSPHFLWQAARMLPSESRIERVGFNSPVVYGLGLLIIIATALAFLHANQAEPSSPASSRRIVTALTALNRFFFAP